MYDKILVMSKLGIVLRHAERVSQTDDIACGLFVSSQSGSFTKDTEAAIVAGGKYDDIEDTSVQLKENGFSYVLNLGQVQSIIYNAKWQKRFVTSKNLIKALNYYLDNDAFIDFSVSP